MSLLPLEAFDVVMKPLLGKRIGYIRPTGNVGDQLIERGTFYLFDRFGIDWFQADPSEPIEADELVFAGGGNMGNLYDINNRLRDRCLEHGVPMTIFPQTFNAPEDRKYHRVYVRDRESLKYCPEAILAPDMALGWDYENKVRATRRRGVFLRKDYERTVRPRWWNSYPDPAKTCKTVEEYIGLAARYETIITNRLHFAIGALMCGRRAILLPNSYHKNRSMYETWLKDLGCLFAETVAEAKRL